MNINNNSLTYLENDIFNLGNKISVTKKKCPDPSPYHRHQY